MYNKKKPHIMYIGQSTDTDRRLSQHLRMYLSCRSSWVIASCKDIDTDLGFEILEVVYDISTLTDRETYYINHYQCVNKLQNDNAPIVCSCGGWYHKSNKAKHMKTKKHNKWLAEAEKYDREHPSLYCGLCRKWFEVEHSDEHMKSDGHVSRLFVRRTCFPFAVKSEKDIKKIDKSTRIELYKLYKSACRRNVGLSTYAYNMGFYPDCLLI